MLYSGATLMRTNNDLQERLEKAGIHRVKPVSGPAEQGENLDGDTRGALLRFARFIHKEKNPKQRKPGSASHEQGARATRAPQAMHPYTTAFFALSKSLECGQILDIYA